jgi:hypothetical protein
LQELTSFLISRACIQPEKFTNLSSSLCNIKLTTGQAHSDLYQYHPTAVIELTTSHLRQANLLEKYAQSECHTISIWLLSTHKESDISDIIASKKSIFSFSSHVYGPSHNQAGYAAITLLDDFLLHFQPSSHI